MMRSSLNSDQRQIVDIIESLGFGVIERLSVRGGMPRFEPEPHVIQTIKLDSNPEQRSGNDSADATLKKEFDTLFDRFRHLADCVVNIEVRHSTPFRLTVERRVGEWSEK